MTLDEIPGLISSYIIVVVSTGVFHIRILEFLEALHALKTTVYLELSQASVSANHPSPSSENLLSDEGTIGKRRLYVKYTSVKSFLTYVDPSHGFNACPKVVRRWQIVKSFL